MTLLLTVALCDEKVEFILFFQIDWGKTPSAARNWTNFVPQTDATTFAFSSNSILLLWCTGPTTLSLVWLAGCLPRTWPGPTGWPVSWRPAPPGSTTSTSLHPSCPLADIKCQVPGEEKSSLISGLLNGGVFCCCFGTWTHLCDRYFNESGSGFPRKKPGPRAYYVNSTLWFLKFCISLKFLLWFC